MATFTAGIELITKVVIAFGTFWIVIGLVIFGTGFKDKTGPQMQQAIGMIIGGLMIILAAALLSNISF